MNVVIYLFLLFKICLVRVCKVVFLFVYWWIFIISNVVNVISIYKLSIIINEVEKLILVEVRGRVSIFVLIVVFVIIKVLFKSFDCVMCKFFYILLDVVFSDLCEIWLINNFILLIFGYFVEVFDLC